MRFIWVIRFAVKISALPCLHTQINQLARLDYHFQAIPAFALIAF